jgi:hypothetical protein
LLSSHSHAIVIGRPTTLFIAVVVFSDGKW